MLFETHSPMIPGQTIDNPKADYRTAEKFGFFRISDTAFYQPNGSYLPRHLIENAVIGWGSAHVTGCCAGGIPVPRLVITAGEKKFQFLCDSEKIAAKMANKLNE